MPDFNYQPNGGGYNFQFPSFSSIFGQSPTDLISFISGQRNQTEQNRFDNQSKLLGQQLAEQGREFNTSSDLQRNDQTKKYSYLDDMLRDQRTNDLRNYSATIPRQVSEMSDLWNKSRPLFPWTQAPNWTFTSGYSRNQ